MQRLNAATCLLFALLGGALPCHSKDWLQVEVVQTHTGVRLGASEPEISINAEQVLTGCNGKSGTYTRELGFYCGDSGFPVSQEPAESRRGYAFFYDVRVIMPDKARLVFHCSTVLDRACEGFPAYPEDTAVMCSNFAQAGVTYKDCTASGPSAGSIGMYRAALHGDRMTIFGSNWRRNYLQNGTWQLPVVVAQDAKPSQPQRTEATPPADDERAPSQEIESAPCQDDEPALTQEAKPVLTQEEKPSPPQETKPAPAQEEKPSQLQETKPPPVQEEKPAPAQETKPPAQEEKPPQPQETKPAPAAEEKPAQPQETQPAPTQETKPAPAAAPTQETNNSGAPGAVPSSIALVDHPIDPQVIEQAKAGDMVAQYKLGYDYYLGHGVALDYVQAAIWWKKAAEQGYPNAQNNLGVLYNSGKGVPQSYTEAYFWQNLAAARAGEQLQAQFAKNRDESAAKLWLLPRLGVQRRAAKWAAEHPVPPRSNEPKADQK